MSDYSSNFPTQSPTFAFDAKAGKLDSRLSYSRSSGGTYLSNEKALSRENLLLQSQDFDTSPWQNFNLAASGLTSGATAPDGTSTAWLLTSGVSSGSTSTPGVYLNLYDYSTSVQQNSQNTYVMHVKSGTATHAWVTIRGNSSNYVAAVLDFSNTSSLTTYQAGWTLDSYQLTAVGNSWYRVALTFTSNTVVNSGQVYVGPTDSNSMTTYFPQWAFNGETMFAWGAQLSSTNSKVYDSPTTTQISREYAPLLKTAAADTPRFEYAADGQSVAKGLLIEAQTTNLLTYSEDFSNAAWTKTSVTATAEAISPDGSLNAFALRENTGSFVRRIQQFATVGSGKVAFSVFAKLLGAERRLILRDDTTTGDAAVFDLSSGTVAATNVGGAGVIEPVGNGWYRCTLIATPGAGSKNWGIWLSTATATSYETYTGDGYSGALIFGAMCENASASSSYLESLGSSTTRAADSCSLVSEPLLDNGSGGLTVEYDMRDASDTAYVLQLERSVGATNGGGVALTQTYLAVENNWQNVGTTTSNVFHKVAASWQSGSQKISRDGSAVAENTATVVPSGVDTLHIGTRQDGGEPVNGHIRNIAIFAEPLTSTNLTTLSQL